MPIKNRAFIENYASLFLLLALITASLCCTGCGGGGGSSNALSLHAVAPELTGKTGQQVSVPIEVTGRGIVNTASFDIHFNSGVFDPVLSETSTAIEIASANALCRYKWIDAQTVRVMYASSDGVASGVVLVNIPLSVVSEGQSNLALRNVTLNK